MKKYIILLLFFINFAFVFQHGKIGVTVGVEVKAQDPGEPGDGYFSGWSVDDFANFISSEAAEELGIGGNVWTSANDFINSTDPELLLTMLGVSLDPASYATGDGGYSGYQPDGSASDQNITMGSNVLIVLRDEDGDGIFDKVHYF